ncbi:ImmA/IrrE family metallo-endopeptidase [Acidaminococcus sp.]|uniref:ImmA/IrrE family metallo-endopeptidase n=1 Tax=Acidaminococcus sp. TaxID=1872103 RepID=UPI003D7CE509
MQVTINPQVLEWAFSYARKNQGEILKKFPKYEEWIYGDKNPTIRQLEGVAKFTGVPFGYLLLKEVPQIKVKPVKDFRTIRNRKQRPEGYSTELRDTIRTMRERQEWLSEYKKKNSYAPVTFLGTITTTMDEQEIFSVIRKALGIPEKWFEDCKKNESMTYFRNRIEALGVVVFMNGIVGNNTHRKLNLEEFRGFALPEPYAPLIFINGADTSNGRLFTLLHELVHLFLGQEALDDGTEAFCNKIAAGILVPYASFKKEWRKYPNDFDVLADLFPVSKLVLYRVALTLGLISQNEWEKLHFGFLKQLNKKETGGGGNFNYILPNRIGRSFSHFVFNAVQEGNLLYTDAYRLLGIRGKTFQHAMKEAEAK